MKYGIIIILILTSVSAFSADEVLDPIALAYFRNQETGKKSVTPMLQADRRLTSSVSKLTGWMSAKKKTLLELQRAGFLAAE